MRIPYFAWIYKVTPAPSVAPYWNGWRLIVWKLDILEPCEFWNEYEAGSFNVIDVDGEEDEVEEDPYYPLCPPDDECDCCRLGRARGAHRHSGLTSTNSGLFSKRLRESKKNA